MQVKHCENGWALYREYFKRLIFNIVVLIPNLAGSCKQISKLKLAVFLPQDTLFSYSLRGVGS